MTNIRIHLPRAIARVCMILFFGLGYHPWGQTATSQLAIDPTFNPAPGPNGPIMDVSSQLDGKILVAGEFTQFNGEPRSYLARLNPKGGLDAAFNPVLEFRTAMLTSKGIKVHPQADGTIFIGGTFSHVNGIPRAGVARLKSDGTLDLSFDPGTAFGLAAVQPDGKVITQQLSRLNVDGTLDTSFVAAPSVYVLAAALQSDGRIVALTGAGGVPPGLLDQFVRVLRFEANGARDASFNDQLLYLPWSPSDHPMLLVQSDDKFLVSAASLSLPPAPELNRFDRNGTLDASFRVTLTPTATAVQRALPLVTRLLTEPDGKILVSGRFTALDGIVRDGLARLNADGALDQSFEAPLFSEGFQDPYIQDPTIYGLAWNGSDLLVSGDFRKVGGLSRNAIVKLLVPVVGPKLSEPQVENGEFVFSFRSQSGLRYTVECEDPALGSTWQSLWTTAGDGQPKMFHSSVTNSAARWYRIRVE